MAAKRSKLLDYSAWIHHHRTLSQEEAWQEPPPMISKPGWCPYCRKDTGLPFLFNRSSRHHGWRESNRPLNDEFMYSITAYECSTCGWWDVNVYQIEPGDWGDHNEAHYRAVLKAYDAADITLPIDTLRQELLRKGEIIHQIHDRKMEELTGAILQDFYPGCEVHLCGKSGDQGIDLLVVVHDSPIAVQVKRRTKPDR
jgi:restriction system protein